MSAFTDTQIREAIEADRPERRPFLVVEIEHLPGCDLCGAGRARYDAKTKQGPWGYLCGPCFETHGLGSLGVGVGQRLIEREEGS